MSISTHIPAIPQTANKLITDNINNWKPGQILIAKTEVGGESQNKVLLRIGTLLLEAKTPIALKTGDNVNLLIKQTGDLPVLKILSNASTQQIAANKLLNIIGQQTNVKALVESSSILLSNPALSKTLRQQLQTLVNSLPKLSQLTNPQELQSLIKNNSVFLESSLRQKNNIFPEQNLKLQILKLSQQLKLDMHSLFRTEKIGAGSPATLQHLISQYTEGKISAHKLIQLFSSSLPVNYQHSLISLLNNPAKQITTSDYYSVITKFLTIINTPNNAKQLTTQVKNNLEQLLLMQDLKGTLDNTLARITSQQLAPLTRDNEQTMLLLFDILFRDHKTLHLVEFNLEHTRTDKNKKNHDWTVTIKFNFEELGPMQAEIKLSDNRITTLFQADHPKTAETIRNNLGLLETSLSKAGFDISSLGILNKKITEKPVLPVNIPLLDVKV